MYQKWLEDLHDGRKKFESLQQEINDLLLEGGKKKNLKFRKDEFKIIVDQDPRFKKLLEKENEKVEQIVDRKFWSLDHTDFDKLCDENLGRKGMEILQLIKPFYQNDLVSPFESQRILINMTKELRADLRTDPSKYNITPEYRSNSKTGNVVDCNRPNIWLKERGDQILKNIQKDQHSSTSRGYISSVLSSVDDSDISLRELYEEKIEQGLDTTEMKKLAKSTDMLDQLLFLYVIKRAQNHDEIAANLLYTMYEKAVERHAEFWITGIEIKYEVKFNPDSELGKENVKHVAKLFLSMLIAGDDPEALITYIKKLDDHANIELIFTRNLGSKIKKLVKYIKRQLDLLSQEYQQCLDLGKSFDLLLSKKLEPFANNCIEIVKGRITEARRISNELTTASDNNIWYDYRKFINENDFSEQEKIVYEIFKKHEELINVEYYPLLEMKWLQINSLSNPLNWFSMTNWFNNKIFDATRNDNFTNWLLKSTKNKPGAIESLLLQWIRSKYYMKNNRIKSEFITRIKAANNKLSKYRDEQKYGYKELSDQDNDLNEASMIRYNSEKTLKNNNPTTDVDKLIIAFLENRRVKKNWKRDYRLLQEVIKKNVMGEAKDYFKLGAQFGLKRRQTIKIYQQFKEFSAKTLKKK